MVSASLQALPHPHTMMSPQVAQVQRDVDATIKYSPLTTTTSRRLLKTQPERSHGQVLVILWEVLEVDDTPYRCLSYTWDPVDEGFPKLINSKLMKIRKNLHDFRSMAAQRLDEDPDWLGAPWVDALCINQEDDQEKNIQVQRMRTIYHHASEALI
ncbi:hypothetical protein E8E11_001199 [Didymella keratinophila]|nr:hypothetical protein E8E11_001199 [Didymella keratinophila]